MDVDYLSAIVCLFTVVDALFLIKRCPRLVVVLRNGD